MSNNRFSFGNLAVIFRREFANYFNTPIGYVFLASFLFLVLFFTFYFPAKYWDTGKNPRELFRWIRIIFLIFIPAITMRLWAEEKRMGTIENLFTLPLRPSEIICGKFLSAVAFLGVTLIGTFFLSITSLIFADPDPMVLFGYYIAALLLGASYIAIGMLISFLTRDQINALLGSFLTMLFLYLASTQPVLQFFGKMRTFIAFLAIDSHANSIERGLLDTRDFIYFFSLIAMMLYINYIAINIHRGDEPKEIAKNWGMSRRYTLPIVIFLFLSLNWASSGIYARADLSREGFFDYTDASRNLLRNLPENATIEAFISDNIPDEYVPQVQKIRDFLFEYTALSRGRVDLTILDPMDDEDAKKRSRELGIQPAQLGAFDQEQQKTVTSYLSLAITYLDQKEVINTLLTRNGQISPALEYELTARFHKIVNPNSTKVGFVNTGSFGLNQAQSPFTYNAFKEAISRFYGEIVPINLDEAVSSEISVLILPQIEELTDVQKFYVDQYILRGGNLIIVAGGMTVNFNSEQWLATTSNISVLDFYRHYGIDIKSQILFDEEKYIPFTQPINLFRTAQFKYPLWIVVDKNGLDQNNIVTKDFASVFLPYASPISFIKKDKVKFTQLATSSPSTWQQENYVVTNPRQVDQLKNDKKELKAHPLMISATGTWSSFFTQETRPKQTGKDFQKKSTKPSQIVAISSPYALTDFAAQQSQGLNINLLLGFVDQMQGFEDLLSLRKKRQEVVQEQKISPTLQQVVTLINFILPLGFITGGGFWHLLRRRKLTQLLNKSNKMAK